MVLELDDYEIENLLKALELFHSEELKKGKWEPQPHMNGQYYYTPTKKSKQIKFTINNIKRQIQIKGLNND